MGKVGRPKGSTGQHTKDKAIQIRTTRAEREVLKERAERAGFASVSEYLRTKGLAAS